MTCRFVLRRLLSIVVAGTIGLGAWAAFPGTAAASPAPVAPSAVGPADMSLFPAMQAAGSVLGHPYRWGGTSPGGFDCSGLVKWSFAQAGRQLPRSSGSQRAATFPIGRHEARPGDLVFFGSPTHHVGIYMGDGLMVHSPRRGDVVKIAPVDRTGVPHFGRVK